MRNSKRNQRLERLAKRSYTAKDKAGRVVGSIRSIRQFTHAVIGGGRVLSWSQSLGVALTTLADLSNLRHGAKSLIADKEIAKVEAVDLGG